MINLASVQNYSLFQYLELVEKFVVGGNGGSAGARISRPIIVIRLESKLIKKDPLKISYVEGATCKMNDNM